MICPQVHKAVLHDGQEVAVKIQYPGVAKSIDSDINNLLSILKIWQILPKGKQTLVQACQSVCGIHDIMLLTGMYVENLMDVSRLELAWECDYRREAKCMKIFAYGCLHSVDKTIDHSSSS